MLMTEVVADRNSRVVAQFADGLQVPISDPIDIGEAVQLLSNGAACFVNASVNVYYMQEVLCPPSCRNWQDSSVMPALASSHHHNHVFEEAATTAVICNFHIFPIECSCAAQRCTLYNSATTCAVLVSSLNACVLCSLHYQPRPGPLQLWMRRCQHPHPRNGAGLGSGLNPRAGLHLASMHSMTRRGQGWREHCTGSAPWRGRPVAFLVSHTELDVTRKVMPGPYTANAHVHVG